MASIISLPPNNMQSSKESMLIYIPKQTTIDLVGGIRCNICLLTFATKKDYDTHYTSHPNVKEIIYTCNICYKEIAGYPSFRGHCYTNHVIKDRFKCEHCSKQFSKLAVLNEHINIVHKFKCPSCSKEFPNRKEMLLHQIIHSDSDKPPYKCKTCKIDIDTVDECKEHVELHLQFLYSCPVCNESISDKANAGDHMRQHFGDNHTDEEVVEKEITKTSEETFIEHLGGIFCELCSTVLKNRVEFDAHFSCEHGDEDIVYMCVVCGKTFEKYSVFYNHCYNHSVRNRYECNICQKSFTRASLLATHMVACQQAGATNGKPFACTVCDHRFGCAGRWREHLRDVHGFTRLPCPRRGCDLAFDTPKELILHQQSHDITIRHYCNQCKLAFTTLAACEHHMELHRKKIFYCPVCKRNYRDKYLIMKHVSEHFETVLHLCKVCGKLYTAKRRLAEHMKTHSIAKNHSCKYCNKTFSKPHMLEEHLNTHTGSKPYKCPVCVKTFASYPNWRKHVRRMHTEENVNLKNPLADRTESLDEEGSAMETVVDEDDEMSTDITDDTILNTDDQISVDGQDCNAGTVANIVNHSENADCLGDIDHANASIDFANVKLETYIFSETNVGNIEVENILSIPVGKDLFNENNAGNVPMGNHLFNANSAENNQIETHLFNGNSAENNPIETHLFNGNNVENNPIETHLFNGNSAENNPIEAHLFNGNSAENNQIETHLFNGNNGENNSIASHLFNGNSGENAAICSEICNGNSVENTQINGDLFNVNSGEGTAIGRDLFNGNNEENVVVGKDLYHGNNEETVNPVDILEYIAEMPENNSMFVSVMPQEPLAATVPPPGAAFPCEYGPEFSAGFDAPGFLDLDDHMLPHIDPLLTIRDDTCQLAAAARPAPDLPKWEPPIITKLYDEYPYGYETDANRLSMMNTDIF
ncbi:uncharacterized protein [Epargyreus clarus]|uniref:uncharacterized protein n=1 Tax=Epargyreus clarus TaxID=520877 RepID=UPI003C2C9C4A